MLRWYTAPGMKGIDHIRKLWAVIAAIALCSAALVLLTAPPASAQFVPAWQQAYLRGLRLERDGRYDAALKAFGFARALNPHPRKDVRFPSGQRLGYDPYYHMAYCLAHSGGSPRQIKRLGERSAQAGVTPRSTLEELRDYVLSHDLGAAWKHAPEKARTHPPRRRPPRPTSAPAPATQPPPARLDLTAVPAAVTAEVDGRTRGSGHTILTLTAGPHRVRLLGSGRRILYDRKLKLEPGETLAVVLPKITARPTPAATTTPTATPAPRPPSSPVPAASAARGPTPGPVHRPRHPREVPALILIATILLVVALAALLFLRRRRRNHPALEAAPTKRLASPPGGLTGYTFGRYEIEGKLGSGGMATTYRARRSSDGKEVALKIPHDTCLEDETFRKRFLREGALGTQLHHPNLVRIIETGEDHGMPYIAMELVHGVTLRDVLRMAGQLPLDRALDLTRQTAEALDYAHSKGVIHRDLKPENLMVLPDNHVMVMDFGIARIEGGAGLTSTSVVMGTPAYTAPESLAREPVDHRADLYALGMILFEMLEGRGPFPEASPLEQLQAHLEGRFPTRSELTRPLPDPVWDLILRLVARNPDDRFPSAEALLVDLGSIIRDVEEGRL